MPLLNRSTSKAFHSPKQFSMLKNITLIFAAAAILALAPSPAFAQHGGGGGFGGGGGHAGGGGFGGGHSGGGGGYHGGGGGGYHGGGGGGYHAEGGSGGGYQSAHGSANSNGGGHWWSGIFGGHHSNNNNAAASREPAAGAEANSQASIAAQRAFANAVARDNLAVHNTWQDPPPDFRGPGASTNFAMGAQSPRGNSLTNARPFTPPVRTAPVAGNFGNSLAPRAAVAAPPTPRGHLGPRFIGYPYYYYPPYFFGGLGFGLYGGYGYGFGCGGFWGGWGNCYGGWGGAPFWGGYGGYDDGYGYLDNGYGDMQSGPNYQVFSGGADSGPDNSTPADNDNGNPGVTYQNSPQDSGMSADQSSAVGASSAEDQPFVLYLKDGTSYAVTHYWVAGGKLHYVTTYGGENSVPIEQVNVQKTVDENAALGHAFTLTPAPPPSQGPPPSMDNAPPSDNSTPQN
jgi:hypothetical protein